MYRLMISILWTMDRRGRMVAIHIPFIYFIDADAFSPRPKPVCRPVRLTHLLKRKQAAPSNGYWSGFA